MMRLFIIAGVLVAALIVVVLLVLSNGGKPAPTASPTPAAAASGTPKPSPRLTPAADHDRGTVELSRRFPAVRMLPYQNPYWEMAVGGEIKNNVLPLNAAVYVRYNQNADAMIKKQRPHIVEWLTKIGQAPGTYGLNVRALRTDGY
jgi:hypothetical protein